MHTKLYLNHASLNSRWKAGFHEGREITYLQEIDYIQEIQNITKKIQVILRDFTARLLGLGDIKKIISRLLLRKLSRYSITSR